MSTNAPVVDTVGADEHVNWIVLDGTQSAAATYASIVDMRTAPIRLRGVKAAQVAGAKRSRLPQPARPLPID